MRYFERVEHVDVGSLLEELDGQPDAWQIQTGRQDKDTVQRESMTIPIRGLRKSCIRGRRKRDVHESRYTRLSQRFPVVKAWLQSFAARHRGELGRARIVRLAQGARVYPHVDRGEYYEIRDRYHLVLRSAGSQLRSGGEEVEMQAGELWWFDNKQEHEAENASDEERIHLIFDLLPSGPSPARSYRRTADRLEPELLDLDASLAAARDVAEDSLARLVQGGVRVYLAAREDPERWKKLVGRRAGGREDQAPFEGVMQVLLPGAAGRLERRCARAMSWCMAHLERGDLRWHDIPKRIASEGGVAAVARAWKAERPGGERQATPRDPG